ncbi:MAG: hypothetical protein F4Z73_04655 [Synechococcus sp. SB0668_bin_13]|nr:hypothetical protein [Synechococcus sp. SB0668_bin_13]
MDVPKVTPAGGVPIRDSVATTVSSGSISVSPLIQISTILSSPPAQMTSVTQLEVCGIGQK